tara:strand:- start:56 stop:760 length:705 start_codon:yes stop_codon:yes gene_type:complete
MDMTKNGLIAHETYFTVISQRTLGSGFFDDACKEFYLCRLLQCQSAFHVHLHAYLLMEQRILLMFTPRTPFGFSAFTKFLSENYNDYYSIRFERRVQAWQKSMSICLLPSFNLIQDCQKFIERFVIKMEVSTHPGKYHYSSYCANAFSLRPKYLRRHQAIIELAHEDSCALESYREFIETPFREEHERFLDSRLLHGHPLLGKRIRNRLEEERALTDIDKSGTIAPSRLREGSD